jgi:3-deoxy-D-manno-octulosonate 8-phosphate phosphatase (KDO 8-P phosphatase)
VRERALWVSRRPGGHGAVREFARALLVARGEWDGLVDAYVTARGGMGDGPAAAAPEEAR